MGSKPAAPRSKRPPQGGQQRDVRKGTRNLNRSEERALRIRAAATAAAHEAAADDIPSVGAQPAAATGMTRMRRTATTRVQSVGRIAQLSRDQEYSIIRGDLRRLLTISAVLLVAMIALLIVLPD